MLTCKFCGEVVHWHKGIAYDGKGCHRERCTGLLPEYRAKLRDQNHEQRVRAFLARSKKRSLKT